MIARNQAVITHRSMHTPLVRLSALLGAVACVAAMAVDQKCAARNATCNPDTTVCCVGTYCQDKPTGHGNKTHYVSTRSVPTRADSG
jgi:hypothetical protein